MFTLNKYETIPLQISSKTGKCHQFQVKLATSQLEKENGLMFKLYLNSDQGMFFDFSELYQAGIPVTIWMKNTFISLDILFIDTNGTIVKIIPKANPFSQKLLTHDSSVNYVLELKAGICKKLSIDEGDLILGIK